MPRDLKIILVADVVALVLVLAALVYFFWTL
jgi:hypothetical protein